MKQSSSATRLLLVLIPLGGISLFVLFSRLSDQPVTRPLPTRSLPADRPLPTLPTQTSKSREHAEQLLARAIEAHGGDERIDWIEMSRTTGTFRGSPEMPGVPPETEGVWEELLDWPNRCKRTLSSKDGAHRLTHVRRDGKEWLRTEKGGVTRLPGNNNSVGTPLGILCAMLAIRDDKLPVSFAGGKLVNGQPVSGIQVIYPGPLIAECYFDDASGLLVQYQGMKKTTPVEIVFDEYRDIEGLQYPMRITWKQGGKLTSVLRISKVEFLESVDEAEFAEP